MILERMDWNLLDRVDGKRRTTRPAPVDAARGAEQFKVLVLAESTSSDAMVLAAQSECPGESFSDWVGADLGKLRSHLGSRKVEVLSPDTLRPHGPRMAERLRERKWEHFFFQGLLEKKSLRLLPKEFGVLIRFEEDSFTIGASGAVFTFVEGHCTGAWSPDLSELAPIEQRNLARTVEFLELKLGIPLQGLSIPEKDWRELEESENPWRELMIGVRDQRYHFVPKRMNWWAWLALKGGIQGLLGF